jgi:LPXTG-site transpeptidase (sortase) family protein
MSNPFPQTLDVDTATATPKGTVNKQDHSVGVTIDRLMPGEKVTVSISVKVNSSATKTETLTHSVTVTYNPGNKTITGSVSYKIKASGLPGTGELPFEDPPPRPLDWSLIFLGAILGMVAFFAVWYGVWARTNQPANGARVLRLALGLGLILLLGGAATAGAGLGLLSPQETLAPPVALADTPTPEMLAGYAIAPAFSPTPVKAAAYHNATAVPYPTLPSFPIPSPTNVPTPASNDEPPPDTSPVVRLIIPALGLDAVVAYVPFDGQTWLIEGLRQEVAWLGNTSWPGLGGNTGLAAHVTVRGMGNGPFRYLDQLKPGDEVTLYTEKNIYTYRVREQTVVEEGDLAVLDATQTSQITLVTCTDWNQELKTYLKRLIVSADLVETDPLDRRGGR